MGFLVGQESFAQLIVEPMIPKELVVVFTAFEATGIVFFARFAQVIVESALVTYRRNRDFAFGDCELEINDDW